MTTAFEQRKRRFWDAFERLTAQRGVDQDPLMQEWYAGTLPTGVMRGFAATFATQRRAPVTVVIPITGCVR